jgi:predicted membrane protein
MAKGTFRFLISSLLVIILLLGLLKVIFSYSGLLFKLEVVGLVIITFISLIGLTFSKDRAGAGFLFTVGLLATINFLLIALIGRAMHWWLFVVAVLLLLVNLFPGKKQSKPKKMSQEKTKEMDEQENKFDHSQVFDPVKKNTNEVANTTNKVALKSSKSTKKLSGRFVASKRSSIYHSPKCEWAQKINPERKVLFQTKEDAWEKGYKAHGCVKS